MNYKKKILTIAAFSVLAIMLIGGTYAFFAPQQGGSTSTNATVTSNTTDLLTFSINRDISFTVTQNDFQENGTNQSGDATATATLTPNNKTGSATMNYNMYLNIENNPIIYSDENEDYDPELMLQVFDDNNSLVSIPSLGDQVTIKGVTGYDITEYEAIIPLLNNHQITASNNTVTIENWRIVITLINLDVNQNDNTGVTFEAEIIIQKEEMYIPFRGSLYRVDSTLAAAGDVITDEGTYWCEIEIATGDRNYCFSNFNECNEYITDMEIDETYRCEETVITGLDLQDYETDFNAIKSGGYIVYCNDQYLECTTPYATLAECNENNDGSYPCKQVAFLFPVYIKHDVYDDMINYTQLCIHHENGEACFGNYEWFSSASKTAQRMQNKLQNISLGSCGSNNGHVTCGISNWNIVFDYYSDGSANIYFDNHPNVSCSLNSDGSAFCNIPYELHDMSNTYFVRTASGGPSYSNPNLADVDIGYSVIIPNEYRNNISGYLSDDDYNEFLLVNANEGFDACFITNNHSICVKDLLEETPGVNNLEQTTSLIKNKIETMYGYEINSQYTSDSMFFLIPSEELLSSDVDGIKVSIYFEDNQLKSWEARSTRIRPDWSIYWDNSSCGYTYDGYGFCWCE